MQETTKFSFDITFQEAILRFILNNSDGYKALEFIDHRYFVVLEHAVIMDAISTLWKNMASIPSLPVLRNQVTKQFSNKDYAEVLTSQDRADILALVNDLYSTPAKDGKMIIREVVRFSSYVDLRHSIEHFQLEDYNSYEAFSDRVLQAIHKEDLLKPKQGTFLIKDLRERQINRKTSDLIIPSPFHQLNALTSAGGFSPGSVLVVLDKPKRLKTTMLINMARKYLARKKKVLYLDLENGEEPLVARVEQSIGRIDKKTLLRGSHDKEIQKVLRRYRRIGGEMYIRRIPGFSTANVIRRIMDTIYRDDGLLFDVMIIDYLGLMGSISGKTDDFGRISDAYVDVANLAQERGIEVVWTAHHIQRTSSKRERTKYVGDDIAKSIDIVRHAQGIFGLNRSIDEEENGIVRLEIVDGRETYPRGRAYFRVDANSQRVDELTKKEVKELTDAGVLYNPDRVFDEEKPQKRTINKGDV